MNSFHIDTSTDIVAAIGVALLLGLLLWNRRRMMVDRRLLRLGETRIQEQGALQSLQRELGGSDRVLAGVNRCHPSLE